MLPGRGVRAVVEGRAVLAGNAELLRENGIALPGEISRAAEEALRDGCTVIYVAVDGRAAGMLALSDTLRPSAAETIRQVRAIIEKYHPTCELEVDGGIAPKTAPLVVEAGANVLVAGSAVYGKEDIPAAIAALRV